MYADDLKIYAEIRHESHALKLQSDLNALETWSSLGWRWILVNAVQWALREAGLQIIFIQIILCCAQKNTRNAYLGVLFHDKLIFTKHMASLLNRILWNEFAIMFLTRTP